MPGWTTQLVRACKKSLQEKKPGGAGGVGTRGNTNQYFDEPNAREREGEGGRGREGGRE